jgi:phosphate transport system permease protein
VGKMMSRNSIFKILISTGPVLIFSVFSSLVVFLIYNLGENFTDLVAGKEFASVIFGLFKELKDPIAGTLMITVFSVGISTPAGIITGVYLHEYASKKVKKHGIDLFRYLSSLPSIIIGVFGLVMIISLNHFFGSSIRTGIFISAISLSILILPYIVHSTVNALSMIPESTRFTALSLGAKKYQNILFVLLPESISGILGGVVLSIGRAAEDTAVIMLTGAAAFAGIPSKLNDAFEALPFFIYYKSSEYQGSLEMTEIFLSSIIIILISTIFITTAGKISGKIKKGNRGIK